MSCTCGSSRMSTVWLYSETLTAAMLTTPSSLIMTRMAVLFMPWQCSFEWRVSQKYLCEVYKVVWLFHSTFNCLSWRRRTQMGSLDFGGSI